MSSEQPISKFCSSKISDFSRSGGGAPSSKSSWGFSWISRSKSTADFVMWRWKSENLMLSFEKHLEVNCGDSTFTARANKYLGASSEGFQIGGFSQNREFGRWIRRPKIKIFFDFSSFLSFAWKGCSWKSVTCSHKKFLNSGFGKRTKYYIDRVNIWSRTCEKYGCIFVKSEISTKITILGKSTDLAIFDHKIHQCMYT